VKTKAVSQLSHKVTKTTHLEWLLRQKKRL